MIAPPFVTCVTTLSLGGMSWSRFGPTVPVAPASFSVWQPLQPADPVKIAFPAAGSPCAAGVVPVEVVDDGVVDVEVVGVEVVEVGVVAVDVVVGVVWVGGYGAASGFSPRFASRSTAVSWQAKNTIATPM